MCGIAGWVRGGDAPHPMSALLATIAARGPDGEGIYESTAGDWRVSLGHRRLSIIDLATGAQPMRNASGDRVLTYNGEVYNYRDLRRALTDAGHTFSTSSDTEVVLRQLEASGDDGVAKLNGMFAFAAWDAKRRRLLLARDRAGIKPLYYAALPCGGVAFASELTAVLMASAPRALAADGVVSYFFSDYAHAPLSMVRGVRKLPPGHTLVWEDGVLSEPRPFWSVPPPGARPRASDSELARSLWRSLGDAVERQMVADVPVGVFLSGGLDSSVVATLAAARAPSRIKAFAIGFEDATYDESAHARRVAEAIGVDYIEERLSEGNLLDIVDQAVDRLDEPLADASYLPTYLLSRLAARHVKVVLGGDGGDELWAGYPTYRAFRYGALYARLPSVVRNRLVPRAVDALPIDDRYQSFEWKVRRFTHRWDDDPVRRHLRWMSCLDLDDLADAVPSSKHISPATLAARLPATSDELERILALDFTTYMPDSVLTKVDRASMAHGLEARPPLLDDALLDVAFALPSSFKLRHGATKFLLKLAARRELPDGIADRKKKGFGIPLAAWLRGPLAARVADVVADSPVWDTGLVSKAVFARYHDEHHGRRADRSKPLWALYVFDRWLRRHGTHVVLGV